MSTITETSSVATGSGNFVIPFTYGSTDDVVIEVDGETYAGAVDWVDSSHVLLTPAPAVGAVVTRYRDTPVDAAKHIWQGGTITSPELNRNQAQLLSALQELKNQEARSLHWPVGTDGGDLPNPTALKNRLLKGDKDSGAVGATALDLTTAANKVIGANADGDDLTVLSDSLPSLEGYLLTVQGGKITKLGPTIADLADALLGGDGNGNVVAVSRVLLAQSLATLGLKGDPGANTESVGPFTGLAGATISAGTQRIRSSSYSGTPGLGAADYVADPAVDAAYVALWPYTSFINVRDGRGWRLDALHPATTMFGVRGDGLTAQTAALQNFLTYCATFHVTGVLCYEALAIRTSTLAVPSNCHFVIQPGTNIEAATGTARVFQFSAVSSCSIVAGKGALVNGRNVTSSSVTYMVGSADIYIEGLTSKGSGSGKDAYYVGSAATVPCSNIRLVDCVGDAAGRNSISLVGCVDFYALGCTLMGAGVAPGAGVDIEANSYTDVLRRITFEKCIFHGNTNSGAIVEFGTDATFHDCEIYANGNSGIGCANGGNATAVGVRRQNVDICAITAVTAASGKLTLSSTASIRRGMIIFVNARGDGVRPTGVSSSQRYTIWSVSGNDIQLTAVNGSGAIASFSDAGSGTLTSDPEVSALYITVLTQDGQSGVVKITNCRIYGNCTISGNYEVFISTSVDVTVQDCYITPQVSGIYGINAIYSRRLRLKNNHIVSSVENAGAAIGILASQCSDVIEEGNTVRGFAGQALNFASCMDSQFGSRSVYNNCGMLATPSAIVECTSGSGGKFTGATLRQDSNHATTYGANFNGWTSGTIDGCDFTGCGTSNATGLRNTDTSMIIGTNVMFDGLTQIGRTGSKTYDAPSLTTGTETTTTVTVTGAKVGDRAHASLGLTLSGLKMASFTVSAANTVTVVIRNDTGGTVDLASTTLYASAQRIAA